MGVIAVAAAANLGAELGQGVNNFVFNYTKNEYEQKISELERSYSSLDEHLKNLITYRSEISSFWDDSAAEKTRKALNDTIGETEREMRTVKEFIKLFRTTVSELDSSQATINQTIDDMQKLLSLGIMG